MTFDEFCVEMEGLLQETLGKQGELSVSAVIKNNNDRQMTVQVKNGNGCTPVLYLEPYYERWCAGEDLGSLAASAASDYRRLLSHPVRDLTRLSNFDEARDNIGCRLVNFEANADFLAQVPHRAFLDLAVIYFIRLEDENLGKASAVIYNLQAQMWNVSEEDLYRITLRNMSRCRDGEIVLMKELMRQLIVEDLERQWKKIREEGEIPTDVLSTMDVSLPAGEDPAEDVFVLTNRDRYYGAAAVLERDLLEEFAKEHGSFYLIPSSVHEMLLFPENDYTDAEGLRRILCSANETVVSTQDFLSGHVYRFDAESGKLCVEESEDE